MQAHPRAACTGQRVELAGELGHAGLHRAALPEAGAVPHVHAVGARVLRDHEQLAHARGEQPLRLGEHLAERARHEIAAQRRDDAERAAVVAALADLQVRVVAGRELHTLRRHQVDERVVGSRQVPVHRGHHFGGRVGPGDREHLRVGVADQRAILLGAEAAGDDHLAVRGQCLADRLERLLDGRVDEAAGVDDHQIRPLVGRHDRVALGLELGEDLLGVDQRLRAAERHEADGGRGIGARCVGRATRRSSRRGHGNVTMAWGRPRPAVAARSAMRRSKRARRPRVVRRIRGA